MPLKVRQKEVGMNRDEAKTYIKNQIESYLTDHGHNLRKPFKCLNPEHDDSNPSMSYDKRRNKVHCFSCGASYDIFDLIGIEYNLTDPKDMFTKAYELYETESIDELPENMNHCIEPKEAIDKTDYFKRTKRHISETSYAIDRGLSESIIDRFYLGYDDNFLTSENGSPSLWKALIIPTSRTSYLARNTSPTAAKENRIRKFGSSPIFNHKALTESSQAIFIVEGEIDALSIIEVGGDAVALGSTANIRNFVKLLQTTRPTQLLLLSLDNDDNGREATQTLKGNLDEMGIENRIVNVSSVYKDPNEALVKDRRKFTMSIEEAKSGIDKVEENNDKENYLKTSARNYINDFVNGINESVNTTYISTGFKQLDTLMDGGLYEGLYIFGAISSLGKTTLITQIADQIAKTKTDVMIFSLEMARSEIMSKSISRITFTKCLEGTTYAKANTSNAKTTRGITTGSRYLGYTKEEKNHIKESLIEYGDYASHLYIIEGMGDVGVKQIRESVERHIALTGNHPVVIIDYLQILSPYNERFSDKQNTDKAVLELKRISRDFKISVIGISSFNRSSYNDKVKMEAFKESGAIEYSSDVLIGLNLKGCGDANFNSKTAKENNPREVELTILKNRNGSTGEVNFEYYSYFNYFKEV